jgi:hypothetical protein
MKLREFDLAGELAVLVYRVIAGFPREELSGLTSQTRKAAVWISLTSLKYAHVTGRAAGIFNLQSST